MRDESAVHVSNRSSQVGRTLLSWPSLKNNYHLKLLPAGLVAALF